MPREPLTTTALPPEQRVRDPEAGRRVGPADADGSVLVDGEPILTDTHEERCGWAIYTGCEGEVADFHAFFMRREDAERYVDVCREAGPDADHWLLDPCVVPAVLGDREIIAANHYDNVKGAEAVIYRGGLTDYDAARLREEAESDG